MCRGNKPYGEVPYQICARADCSKPQDCSQFGVNHLRPDTREHRTMQILLSVCATVLRTSPL
jgi:hypothetical protein